MKRANLQLETLVCPSCTQKIENTMKGFKEIDQDSIKLSFNSSKLRFEFDESLEIDEVINSINKLGFEVLKSSVR